MGILGNEECKGLAVVYLELQSLSWPPPLRSQASDGLRGTTFLLPSHMRKYQSILIKHPGWQNKCIALLELP